MNLVGWESNVAHVAAAGEQRGAETESSQQGPLECLGFCF